MAASLCAGASLVLLAFSSLSHSFTIVPYPVRPSCASATQLVALAPHVPRMDHQRCPSRASAALRAAAGDSSPSDANSTKEMAAMRKKMLLRGAITAGFNNATGSSAGNLQASADDLLVDRRDDETPQEREARHIRMLSQAIMEVSRENTTDTNSILGIAEDRPKVALLGVLALAAVTVVTWLVWHVTIFAVELAAKLVSACFGALCPMPFCTMSAPVNVGKFARLVAGGMVGGVLVPVIFYPLALWSESARREKKLERERQQQQT